MQHFSLSWTLAVLLAMSCMSAMALERSKEISPADWQRAKTILEESFTNNAPKASPEDFFARLEPDQSQAECSKHHNLLPPALFLAMREREKAKIQYPEKIVLGDWREGEKLSLSGYGLRVGDKPNRTVGGNCYACHAMDPNEYGAGNLGPSLTNYGNIRGNTEATRKYVYGHIYNAWAYVPCSNMPRFGYHGVLSEQQIFDIMAFLLDPESPVNQSADKQASK